MPSQVLARSKLQIAGITLNTKEGQVTGPNGTHHLTPMECRLLRVFMLNRGQVISRAFLMKEVWQTEYLDDMRTLEVHVSWLRKKIEADPRRPRYLRTVRGMGYGFGLR
jgi:DNA-binding response OmpR family regulator